MKLSKKETMLAEAIESFLQHDAKLGLKVHNDVEETSHHFQFLHEQINEMFDLKCVGLTHFEGVRAAFRKVHNYKYIDDPTFQVAMEKEMTAQGIPGADRSTAIDYVPKIIEELKKEDGFAEKDEGFNPNLDEIIEVSQPAQNEK